MSKENVILIDYDGFLGTGSFIRQSRKQLEINGEYIKR